MKQFKTESKRILDLMINSIYTNKEIFLRELISNASDAIDKLKFISLTDSSVNSDFKIVISVNKEDRTLTIEDNGIGMETEELKKMQAVLNLPSCPKEYRHFGLYNIHRRLVQNYGDAYGLSIESEVSEYTRITVYLPYRKSTSQQDAVITENHEEKE